MTQTLLIHIVSPGVLKVSSAYQCPLVVEITFLLAELNKLVRRLDERAKNSPTTHMHSFMRKERVEKSVSSSFPPDDAPKWALRPVRMDSESIVTTPARETADMMSRRQLLNSTVSIASDSA